MNSCKLVFAFAASLSSCLRLRMRCRNALSVYKNIFSAHRISLFLFFCSYIFNFLSEVCWDRKTKPVLPAHGFTSLKVSCSKNSRALLPCLCVYPRSISLVFLLTLNFSTVSPKYVGIGYSRCLAESSRRYVQLSIWYCSQIHLKTVITKKLFRS